jgi:VHL beta domain
MTDAGGRDEPEERDDPRAAPLPLPPPPTHDPQVGTDVGWANHSEAASGLQREAGSTTSPDPQRHSIGSRHTGDAQRASDTTSASQRQFSGSASADDAQRAAGGSPDAQRLISGPSAADAQRSLRGARHISKARYMIAGGAAAVAATAAVFVVKAQQDDAPATTVAAAAETVAPPVATPTTIIATGTPLTAASQPTAAGTVADSDPDTVATEAVPGSEGVFVPETNPPRSAPATVVDTVAPTASAAPAVTSLPTPSTGPPVPDLACLAEATFRSANGDTVANLTVVNNTSEPLQSVWLDYNGQRVVYQQIAPFTSYVQPTWLTHPWIVANQQGTCYRLIVMTSLEQTVTVDPS